jgi:flagellar basal body-associated protein FliL
MRHIKRKPAPARGPVLVLRGLTALAGLLAGVIIAGTIIGFTRSPDSGPLFRIGNSAAGREAQGGSPANGGVSVFSGIGRLRIPLAGSSTLILSIAFPYPSDDQAFTEELAVKIGDFRAMASDYFSSLPAEKIVSLDEEAAKTEILRRYNASLRLGKIDALYFNDLMIIE